MPIRIDQIKVGGYYVTETNQLRLITKITQDKEERDCVHYLAKSAARANTPFMEAYYGRPPLLKTFANAVYQRLLDVEVEELKNRKIIPRAGRAWNM